MGYGTDVICEVCGLEFMAGEAYEDGHECDCGKGMLCTLGRLEDRKLLNQATEWQPIETFPETGKPGDLVAAVDNRESCSNHETHCLYRWDEERQAWRHGAKILRQVSTCLWTHWRYVGRMPGKV